LERQAKIAQVDRGVGGRAAAEALGEVALGQSGKGGRGLRGVDTGDLVVIRLWLLAFVGHGWLIGSSRRTPEGGNPLAVNSGAEPWGGWPAAPVVSR
jgi:hypothetical protein